jgi:cathepsin L
MSAWSKHYLTRAKYFLCFGFALTSAGPANCETLPVPQSYSQRLSEANPAVKSRIAALEERSKKEKWRFRPVYTSALDRSIKRLGRAGRGPSREAALAIQSFSNEALALYDAERTRLKLSKRPPLCNPKSRAFDFLQAGKVSAVEDQGDCGSCWAFASAAVLESAYLIENSFPVHGSEQHLLNCTQGGDCDTGYLLDAFDLLAKAGTSHATDEPYTGVKAASCSSTQKTPLTLVAYSMIDPDWEKIVDPASIKQAMCTHGPVATRMIITESFLAYGGDDVFHQVDPGLTVNDEDAHFVTIIGWDEGKGEHGAWLIKNSWGPWWGKDGFAWIEYGANLIGHMPTWAKAKRDEIVLGPEFEKLRAKYKAAIKRPE